ncbi:MAG TPA: DNA-formamidopyrimidine glycosylase family protein, partial [Mycobacteriales bacterium]
MPELPEVEALAAFLRGRVVGLAVARVDVGAIHVLKTYDPPPAALAGSPVTGVSRHGKFLDVDVDGTHLVVHLSRAGWLRFSESLPTAPLRPSGKGPTALRVHLEDGSGFDLTEAGTQKRLAVYLVTDPRAVPGVARLGIDVLSPDFTPEALARLLAQAKGARVKTVLTDQSVLAGVGNAYSDEVLWAARLSPFTPCSSLSAEKVGALYDALTTGLRDAVARAAGLGAAALKAEKKAGLQVHGRTG